jgi:hypothetical protein
MSGVREEGLDADVIDALDEEARSVGASSAARARVASRLARSIAMPPRVVRSHGWSKVQVAAPIAAFVAGAIGTALVMNARPPRERAVYVDRVVTVPSAPSSSPSVVAPMIDLSSSPPAPSHAPSSASPPATLADEQSVLDVARAALGRGDGASALSASNAHARRFPNGQLAPEREAIAIQALMLLGRSDDARARANRFRTAHPGSALLPAIDEAIGETK